MASQSQAVGRERQIALTGLVLGPTLLVAGLAIAMQTDAVAAFLPLERAWIQGAIALPMLILAPAALSLAWSDASVEPAARWLSRGIALAIGLWVVGWFAATLTHILCEPVTNPLQTLRVGLPMGVVAGGGFFGSVAAGRWFASSERPVAAIAAGVAGSVLAFAAATVVSALLFPGVSCAAPQPPV